VSLALVAWAALVRLPFGIAPRADADAALFWLIGHGWRMGELPYLGTWDIKPPGIFLVFAFADALFGAEPFGGRVLAALAIGAGAVGLYRFGQRVLGDSRVALIAALLLPTYSLLFDGLANKPELFAAPFVIWGITLAAAAAGRSRGQLLLAGLIMGAAPMMKQTAGFEILFVTAYLAWRHRSLPALVAFGAGLAVVPCAFALYFATHGAFAELMDASVFGALLRLHGDGVTLAQAPVRVLASLKTAMPLLVLTGLGWAERKRLSWRGTDAMPAHPDAALLAWGWLGAAALAELAMRATYPAYALPLLAPLCLLSARVLAALIRTNGSGLARVVPILVAAVLLWPVVFQTVREDPDHDSQPVAIAAYLRQQVPARPIYVVNYDPVVYLLSGAPTLTRFSFHQHLVCDFPALPVAADAEIRRIMAKRPAALVFASPTHHMVCERPERIALVQSLARGSGYRKAAAIPGKAGAVEIWLPPVGS
jgi:4-amino-4-deoxy-L-arabinose transferase-like glycosyltransferase